MADVDPKLIQDLEKLYDESVVDRFYAIEPAVLAKFLHDAGWIEKHDASPFVAPVLEGRGFEPWKKHMAALAEEMHKRSHELNPSLGAGQYPVPPGATPEQRTYIEFVQRLHDAVAYLYNCNSSPDEGLHKFDAIELASKLRYALSAGVNG